MSNSLTFKGGIHPLAAIHHGKPLTEKCEIIELPAPKVVKIPLSQHIGAPAKAIVNVGDRVLMGQKIGEAEGFVSVPCYSSVSGTVLEIGKVPALSGKLVDAVIIENDFKDEVFEEKMPELSSMNKEDILNLVKEAGIVGMGGATFPTHVKLNPPKEDNVNLLIINGAECEPFLTADHRLMKEYPKRVIFGTKVLMNAVGVSKAFIGVEENKPDAIKALSDAIDDHNIKVVPLKVKYPQGGEKQLINAITGRVVKSGCLPSSAGVVVVNVATAKAVSDRIIDGEPLIRRVTTVTGSVNKPVNVLARIGTPISELIEAAGGYKGEPMKLISGGPMMGISIPTDECVVTKGTSGVLVLGKEYLPKKEVVTACIKCARCASACPISLMPMDISAYSERGMFDKTEELGALDCISCGSCTYVCPAKRTVSQFIKLAKDEINLARAKKRAKENK